MTSSLRALRRLGAGRTVRARRLADVRRVATEEVVALGEDLRELELDVQASAGMAPGAEASRSAAALREAIDAYGRARTRLDAPARPADARAVGADVAEGRWALEAARAALAGDPPPPRRPPCFFDPRHGPSAREVAWSPEGAFPRMAPACDACARWVERGREPLPRELAIGGRRVPYWRAPAHLVALYADGMFGGSAARGLFALPDRRRR